MRYFDKAELDDSHHTLMAEYDAFVQSRISFGYPGRIRMRGWELHQVLDALPPVDGSNFRRALDTGSVNTFLALYLTRYFKSVVASDLLVERVYKNLLRRVGVLPRKPYEVKIETWFKAIKSSPRIQVRNVNLTNMRYPDGYFDVITSISVIEHIPDIEAAIKEMFRCIKPGGKLLITTDCSPDGKPYSDGVRYFSPSELKELFSPYPVTSETNDPDFKKENWCYRRLVNKPVLNVFVEITKQ
ncbi:MAG: class I SAM-dependent methyltransferase [Opitutae bacterium]|jgi:SAM-dependent methyltransferase|nr:class I SAM-dependent methyltransferase [Opitutae bacterium]MBT5379995.1 class I SAM-dependent methyltransferase [Opitutae bacterium]MBT5691106.1 class I SAM-dependent methyltransferase [Opitutae bacterium]MBT6462383.1 class I SAM-dependent methyltransferase [Opitutae bacterium]MBT7853739.1 class I SAM-dependent methyltransferase [Opitutae bacterium]